MAYIGMRSPVFAPITDETPGSAITYGSGMVIGTAVGADLTFEIQDNEDRGDDIVVETDDGINGYTGTLETNNISKEGRAAVLGWTAKTTTSNNETVVTHYEVGSGASPAGGWGFIRVKMEDGVRTYEAFWFHKGRFNASNIKASTKPKQIEWNHPSLSVKGIGVVLDSSGEEKWFDWMEFSGESAAKTWLYGRANISTT